MMTSPRIDVHTHYLGGRVKQLFDSGFSLAGGYTMSVRWTPDEAIAYMDRQGIATQILSTPWTFTGTSEDSGFARRFTRSVNEEYAQLIEQYPGRFGAFAALPGDTPDAMVEELEYALDALHLDGVLLTSNTRGIYLGMDWYEPVLAELNRRQVPVLLHPTDSPVIVDEFGFGRPSSVCEFTFDTARNVINAIYRGVFQRYPQLKVILAHCGGPLPTLGWRIAEHTIMGTGPHDAHIDPAHVTDVLSDLYYETALAGARHSLLPTLEVTNSEHILFGTDWPAAPESTALHNTTNLMNSGVFSEDELRGVQSGNAKRLFPRLA